MTVPARLHRLLAADGKCFDVAIDHGFFNEPAFLVGIENMEQAVRTIVAANPDAIQLTAGQAWLLQEILGKAKPSLVLRTDVANIYNKELHHHLFSEVIDRAVEQALVLDAACVVVNLLLAPGQPELHHQCVANVLKLKRECEIYAMPLMVEPLVLQPNSKAGGYMVDGDVNKIVALVRQAVELGADIVKADPCDDIAAYYRVIEAAGDRPVLPRGGGRAGDREVLERTYTLMQQGAAGIVYGRNVIQHAHPDRMTRALMAIVHDGATPDRAAAILGGEV